MKITFYHISHHFISIHNFFHKMAVGGHFGCPKHAFLTISDQYPTFSKWLPAAILDARKSLSIVFLSISDQYATFSKWLPVAIFVARFLGTFLPGRSMRKLMSAFRIKFMTCTNFYSRWLPFLSSMVYQQGNQRWGNTSHRHTPLKSKILISFHDVISLLVPDIIFLIDRATQEVPMKII